MGRHYEAAAHCPIDDILAVAELAFAGVCAEDLPPASESLSDTPATWYGCDEYNGGATPWASDYRELVVGGVRLEEVPLLFNITDVVTSDPDNLLPDEVERVKVNLGSVELYVTRHYANGVKLTAGEGRWVEAMEAYDGQ